jgi:hypothetical protein
MFFQTDRTSWSYRLAMVAQSWPSGGAYADTHSAYRLCRRSKTQHGRARSAARQGASQHETRNISEVSAKGKEKSHDFSLALHFHHHNDKSTTHHNHNRKALDG